MAWNDADAKEKALLLNGHTMTSSEALHIVSTNVLPRILVPKVQSLLSQLLGSSKPRLILVLPDSLVLLQFLYSLPIPRLQPYLARINTAFAELDAHMMELVVERRAQQAKVDAGEADAPKKMDLFGSLVQASAEERDEDDVPFGDREVLGNTCESALLPGAFLLPVKV